MDLDLPSGVSHPWVFVQKRDIFELKFQVRDMIKEYSMIHRKNCVNYTKFYNLVGTISELYVQVKEVARKNKNVKKQFKSTLDFFDALIRQVTTDLDAEIFPQIYQNYIQLMDIIFMLGLTNFEKKVTDPGRAVVPEEAQ